MKKIDEPDRGWCVRLVGDDEFLIPIRPDKNFKKELGHEDTTNNKVNPGQHVICIGWEEGQSSLVTEHIPRTTCHHNIDGC